MSEELRPYGRLAFRTEGDFWTAYYARPSTMDGATLLGSIRKSAIGDAELKTIFMALMAEVMEKLVRHQLNDDVKLFWGPLSPPPEHERKNQV